MNRKFVLKEVKKKSHSSFDNNNITIFYHCKNKDSNKEEAGSEEGVEEGCKCQLLFTTCVSPLLCYSSPSLLETSEINSQSRQARRLRRTTGISLGRYSCRHSCRANAFVPSSPPPPPSFLFGVTLYSNSIAYTMMDRRAGMAWVMAPNKAMVAVVVTNCYLR